MQKQVCEHSETMARSLAVTHTKSLDNSLKREVRGKEPAVALAVPEIKQPMAVCSCVPRWVPHNTILCDGLTKQMGKPTLPPLAATKGGRYVMSRVGDEESCRPA